MIDVNSWVDILQKVNILYKQLWNIIIQQVCLAPGTLVNCFVSKHWEIHRTLFSLFFVRLQHQSRGVTFHDINWNDEAAETSHRSSHERLRSEKLSCEASHHHKLQQLLIFSGYILLLISRHNQETYRPANLKISGQSGPDLWAESDQDWETLQQEEGLAANLW